MGRRQNTFQPQPLTVAEEMHIEPARAARAVVEIESVYETWDQSAEAAVTAIFDSVRKRSLVQLLDLRDEFDQFLDNMWASPGGNEHAAAMWLSIAADSIEIARNERISIRPSELLATLIGKQSDYGPDNIKRFGRPGLMVRMHDKIARLENLTLTGRTPKNETIRDTYLDIAGYGAIGIMWETRSFLLPLEADLALNGGAGENGLNS